VHDENITNYFIGSIFFKEDGDEEFHIIDGQQRITSATILITVIGAACYAYYILPFQLRLETTKKQFVK